MVGQGEAGSKREGNPPQGSVWGVVVLWVRAEPSPPQSSAGQRSPGHPDPTELKTRPATLARGSGQGLGRCLKPCPASPGEGVIKVPRSRHRPLPRKPGIGGPPDRLPGLGPSGAGTRGCDFNPTCRGETLEGVAPLPALPSLLPQELPVWAPPLRKPPAVPWPRTPQDR